MSCIGDAPWDCSIILAFRFIAIEGDWPDAARIDNYVDLHARRRITYIGVTHRTRSIEELREETRAMWADLGKAVTTGKLRLPIDKRYPLDQAKTAQEYMRANQHFGKILLIP